MSDLNRTTKISLSFGENLDINKNPDAGTAMGQTVTEANQENVSDAVGHQVEIGTTLGEILVPDSPFRASSQS